MDTSLAETMKLVEDRERYDACAKKIISHKAIIAWILKTCTWEFKRYDPDYIAEHLIGDVSVSMEAVHQDHPDRKVEVDGDEIVEMLNSESSSVREGTVYYDLRFRATVPGDDRSIFIIINIEIQNNDGELKYSVATSVIYYGARLIFQPVWHRVHKKQLPGHTEGALHMDMSRPTGENKQQHHQVPHNKRGCGGKVFDGKGGLR